MAAYVRCAICEEALGREDSAEYARQADLGNIAEMYNPAYEHALGQVEQIIGADGKPQDGIVHTGCGIAAGWEVS